MTAGTHPAPFSAPIMDRLADILAGAPGPILDPFAGTGRIHQLGRDDTWGVEIEPPGTPLHHRHPRTLQGDATALPFRDGSIGTVATSPTYGNRMADRYDGRDGSVRHTYRCAQGVELHPRNSGGMQWGDAYRALHAAAWAEAWRVLAPGGWLVLNVSDHIRRGDRQFVAAWHALEVQGLGFEPVVAEPVPTRRQRHGANGGARVAAEAVMVFRRAWPLDGQLALPVEVAS